MSGDQRQHEPVQLEMQERKPEPKEPKDDSWGAPLDSIPPERQNVLRALADRQRVWAAQLNPEPRQSAFAGVRLTGAEVFFLAAYERAGADSSREGIEKVAARLRIPLNRSETGLPVLHLEGANLRDAMLTGAYLRGVVLTNANLRNAELTGANFRDANLAGATLCGATFDSMTYLHGMELAAPRSWREQLYVWQTSSHNTSAALRDIHWGGVGTVDLTGVHWDAVQRLGDEREVGPRTGASQHEAVVRTYRQLAAQLRVQGMSEVADRFAYRAHVCQRGVLLRRYRLPQYLGSWFLGLLAGYGYRPARTIFWYLVVIAGFAFAYFQATHGLPIGPLRFAQSSEIQSLSWNEALILSVSVFHGRGFFQPIRSLGDPVAGLAALEAVIGLILEVSFIATFTQRYFGSK